MAARQRPGQLIVAFAAETGDVLANGRAKLARKGCDLLVVNQVGNGLAFGTADNEATVLGADGTEVKLPRAAKDEIADAIWDLVAGGSASWRLIGSPPGASSATPVQFGEDLGEVTSGRTAAEPLSCKAQAEEKVSSGTSSLYFRVRH